MISRTVFTAALAAFLLSACAQVQPVSPKPPPLAAHIPTPCMERAGAVAALQNDFSESSRARGITRGGGVLELYATDAGETWTLLLNLPDGVSCLVLACVSWQAVESKAEPICLLL